MARGRKHPGSIHKRGDSWRVQVMVDGRRERVTVTGDYDDAVDKAWECYNRLKDGGGLVRDAMPMSELLDHFKKHELPSLAPNTQRTYRHSLKAFRTFFAKLKGDPKARDVGSKLVKRFLHWRRHHSPDGSKRKKPLAPRTVAKDRTVLHRVLEEAVTLEVATSNPVARVDAPKGDGREPIILTDDQYEKLLDKSEHRPMLWLYILVLGETGVRCDSEALWLRWEDVDLESGLLTVESVRKGRRTKSGKSRKVPMTKRLREAMREHMATYRMKLYDGERTKWVFHHPHRRRRAKAGERIGSLRRGFEAAVERAKLPEDLNQHDLRHRRVTTWLAEGKPAHIVQKAMGHSDLRTTLHYEHLVPDDLLQLVDEPDDEELKQLAR